MYFSVLECALECGDGIGMGMRFCLYLFVVSEAHDAWQRQMLRPATSVLGEDGLVGPGRALRRSWGARGAPLQHLLPSEVVAIQCVPRGAEDSACRGDGDVLHERCPWRAP